MAQDPLSGDVVVLRDYPTGYRRRVGPYRVLFDVDHATRNVQVQEIERRSSTTYRRRR
jgi:mRNA-degrading endonuclease RelE of RelBE toxin-antitoxin system